MTECYMCSSLKQKASKKQNTFFNIYSQQNKRQVKQTIKQKNTFVNIYLQENKRQIKQTIKQNIAGAQNCPDIPIANSLFVFSLQTSL